MQQIIKILIVVKGDKKITLKKLFYIIAIGSSTFIGIKCFYIITNKNYTNGRVDILLDKNIKCYNWKLDKMEEVPCKYDYITDKAKKIFDMWWYVIYGALCGFIGVRVGRLEEYKKQKESTNKEEN